MAWTQTDLDTLDAAIRTAFASPTFMVQSVQFSDQATTFRSFKEMTDLRALIAGGIVDPTTGSRTRYIRSSKGV